MKSSPCRSLSSRPLRRSIMPARSPCSWISIPQTFTIDLHYEARSRHRTKAICRFIFTVSRADMDPILELRQRHGLIVIEDAARRMAAEYNGIRAWSIGDMGASVFIPAKISARMAKAAWLTPTIQLCAHRSACFAIGARKRKYQHVLKGYNYRTGRYAGSRPAREATSISRSGRRRAAPRPHYDLNCCRLVEFATPKAMPYARHVYHVYAIRTAERQKWQKRLQSRGIQTGIHYPIPVHLQGPTRT